MVEGIHVDSRGRLVIPVENIVEVDTSGRYCSSEDNEETRRVKLDYRDKLIFDALATRRLLFFFLSQKDGIALITEPAIQEKRNRIMDEIVKLNNELTQLGQ
jgi:hypothetical protein